MDTELIEAAIVCLEAAVAIDGEWGMAVLDDVLNGDIERLKTVVEKIREGEL
jgi:hypothetical protein